MSGLSAGDWAQIVSAGVVSISFPFLVWQLIIQNKLAKADLLRHRFDMYWQTYEPISAEQLQDFRQNPADYMPMKSYRQTYKSSRNKSRKYIMLTMQFEYLAFLHALELQGIDDPFGSNWLSLWTKDLSTNPEFLEIKNYYRPYYPDYCAFVDGLVPRH